MVLTFSAGLSFSSLSPAFRTNSDFNFAAESHSIFEIDCLCSTCPAAPCSSPTNYWNPYEALAPITPRHHRPSSDFIRLSDWCHQSPIEPKINSPFQSSFLLTPHTNNRRRCSLGLFEKVEQSPQSRIIAQPLLPLFPLTPTTMMSSIPAAAAADELYLDTFSPRPLLLLQQQQQQSTIHKSVASFTMANGLNPLRLLQLRTPSQLHTTITPSRVMGLGSSDIVDEETRLNSSSRGSLKRRAEDQDIDNNQHDNLYEVEDSPLLKASQENSLKSTDNLLPCLSDALDGVVTPPLNTRYFSNQSTSAHRLRQMRQHQDEETISASGSYFGCNSVAINKSKRRKIMSPRQQINNCVDDCDATFKACTATSSSITGLGEQAVDAATILLSISTKVIEEEAKENSLLGLGEEEEEADGEELTLTAKGDGKEENLDSLYPPSTVQSIRIFPKTIPIYSEIFPRFYKRFRVPSALNSNFQVVVFGSIDPDKVQDEELKIIAKRGMKSLGNWHGPLNPFDLYTPRWVRGIGKDKEGLCSICYEEDSKKIIWKRTKTSEYNYHLIYQHGISPHTQKPLDPPIAIRDQNISKSRAGQRKSILQGKCHVCKKYIDLQGRYSGQVKVPEIYWWKHARVCHKGKPGLQGAGGVFVEDKVR